ncbi:MAG: [FeFe] hydrogenase H-cluster maturation GTPase HydF [Bacteroidota bacterium]
MDKAPKSLRLQIALFGRTNVGKSSFLNMLAKQDVAMTSSVPGTTTDVVEKSFELLPIGPVTFLDTAGIDDVSLLSEKRIERTIKILDRADICVLIVESNKWGEFEDSLLKHIKEHDLPVVIAVNKIDLESPNENFIDLIREKTDYFMLCSSLCSVSQDDYLNDFKSLIKIILPSELSQSLPLVGDLVKPGGIAVFVVPIDLQAPKGRLILPQVQSIRDILDNDAISVVVKEREYPHLLRTLKQAPDIVVCDSQVVQKVVADTPPDIKFTTFSILFSRFKGELNEEVRGAVAIDRIKSGDKILIAEACSHHALEDDIGRVKIPRWLRQYIGQDIQIDIVTGRDFPANLKEYKVIIHCGACMLTRTEKLSRIRLAKKAGVPITNYGLTISLVQGVLERALSPFPFALDVFRELKD